MKKLLLILLCSPFLVFSQELKDFTKEPGYIRYIDPIYDLMPTSSCGEIIDYTHYSASFCEEYKLSEWTIHFLTPNRLSNNTRRTNNFRKDPQLNGRDASLSDFKGSGYDRGHMVPAGDMTFDITSMSETFYMTNISPQHPSFNRGGLKNLESKIRGWVMEFDSVTIITGFVKGDSPDLIVDYAGTVPVPAYFYKVFIDLQRKRSIAFVMPNQKITKPLMEYVVSIDYLERITGLDFFYKLPDDIEMLFEIDTGIKEVNR
jgi:endonuclease G